MGWINRRQFMKQSIVGTSALAFSLSQKVPESYSEEQRGILKGVHTFLNTVANEDGSFRPGIDPLYKGMSDTYYTGIAAPTYAVILCETFGWTLPYPDATREFFLSSQKSDGAFYSKTGAFDPNTPLAKLYNTAQSIVALRILGEKSKYDPIPVVEYFFRKEEFDKLPLYTTSFFPYFYTALGKSMPSEYNRQLQNYMKKQQKEDGFLGDHIASTFHMAHYNRLVGAPIPKADEMVERTLRDQQNAGSWCHHPPDWDVHAVFDALFILRQLGNQQDPRIKEAYRKASDWLMKCKQENGGFSHFPGYTADVDATYFQVGALVEAGILQPKPNLKQEEILGWGHAMIPDKQYSCVASV